MTHGTKFDPLSVLGCNSGPIGISFGPFRKKSINSSNQGDQMLVGLGPLCSKVLQWVRQKCWYLRFLEYWSIFFGISTSHPYQMGLLCIWCSLGRFGHLFGPFRPEPSIWFIHLGTLYRHGTCTGKGTVHQFDPKRARVLFFCVTVLRFSD